MIGYGFQYVKHGITFAFHEETTIAGLTSQTWKDAVMLVPPLQWRHNGRDGVSNHQPNDCLLNRLFRRRLKYTSQLRAAGFWIPRTNGQ